MIALNKTPGGIEYILERKKRKTIAVKITHEGNVIASVPIECNKAYAERFMDEKTQWINSKLREILSAANKRKKLNFTSGDQIEILGTQYTFRVQNTKRLRSYITSEFPFIDIYLEEALQEHLRETETMKLLRQYLILEAKVVFRERVDFYSKRIGVKPNRICVKEQKNLWGSCSSKNNLNFNWKLVTAPLSILDYVVVHELCHMKHRNHSKEYWSYVEQIMPDYKDKAKWLRNNGSLLGI